MYYEPDDEIGVLVTPEGRVKAKVKKVLAFYKDVWGDWPVPGGYGKSTLDYHGCSRGRYFAIETKAPGGKLTPRQVSTAEMIRLAGGRVFIIDSAECEGMQALIDWLEPPDARSTRLVKA